MTHETLLKHVRYSIYDDLIKNHRVFFDNLYLSNASQYFPPGFTPLRTQLQLPYFTIDVSIKGIKSHVSFSAPPNEALNYSSRLHSISQTIKTGRATAHISLSNSKDSGRSLSSVLTLRSTPDHALDEGISHVIIFAHEDLESCERASEIHIGLPETCFSTLLKKGVYPETEKNKIDLLILNTDCNKPRYYLSSRGKGPTYSLTLNDVYDFGLPLPYFNFLEEKILLYIGSSTLVIDMGTLSPDFISQLAKGKLIINMIARENGVDLISPKNGKNETPF